MPDIYAVAAQFKAELLRRERAAASRLVQAYGQAWQQIQLDLKQLTDQMESARTSGEVISQTWLFQRARLQTLKSQIERQINQFSRDTDLLIQAEQHAAIEAARIQSLRLIQMALPFDGTQLAEAQISFTQLPNEAIQAQLGFLSNRSPLKKLLAQLGPQAATSAGDALIQAVALGYNPRKTATHLREALGGNLSRALTIARTETLRAYRESSRLQFQANADVLEGWVWISARDSGTCASCWAMHGTIHKLEERLDDHPNGRCTMVPRSKSFEELGITGVPDTRPPLPETGEEAFSKLTPKEQDQILGIAAGKAYRSGQVKLSDFVGRKRSAQWGTMRYGQSLENAIQVARKRQRKEAASLSFLPKETTVVASESVRKQLKAFFGKNYPDAQLAAMVGALDDARVTFTKSGDSITAKVEHPWIEDQIRTIKKSSTGEISIHNDYFRKSKYGPKGTGLKSFLTQVLGAKSTGVSYIDTLAAGSISSTSYNGYYTWPRFGYNAPLRPYEKRGLPPNLAGVQDLNELFRTKEGREWWRQNGSANNMVFDLKDNSGSWQILLSYLKEQGIKLP